MAIWYFEKRPEGSEAAAPVDLLPFRITSLAGGDRNFIDSQPHVPADLDGELPLDGEAVGLNPDGFDHLSTEHLVAGLHVGEGGGVKKVARNVR